MSVRKIRLMYPERLESSATYVGETDLTAAVQIAKYLSMALEGKDGLVSMSNQVLGKARGSCLWVMAVRPVTPTHWFSKKLPVSLPQPCKPELLANNLWPLHKL